MPMDWSRVPCSPTALRCRSSNLERAGRRMVVLVLDPLLAARASRDLRPSVLRRGVSARPISAAASSSSVSVNIADGPPVHEGRSTDSARDAGPVSNAQSLGGFTIAAAPISRPSLAASPFAGSAGRPAHVAGACCHAAAAADGRTPQPRHAAQSCAGGRCVNPSRLAPAPDASRRGA